MSRIVCLFPWFFCLLPFWTAFAQDLPAEVQSTYEGIQSFRTGFEQKLTNAATQQTQERSGEIWFQKPGLVRWETTSPEQEILVVGRERVWDYFPEEAVCYSYPADRIFSSKTMLRFISGRARLSEDFLIEDQGNDNGRVKLRLVPKEPEPELVLAYLWVDAETAVLHKILLVDFFGNGNEVTFTDLELNPEEMRPGIFEFIPPDGVEVLENPSIGG
jgi:outer membrane lipoprotein carrier protein